jgi:hypothetical protein
MCDDITQAFNTWWYELTRIAFAHNADINAGDRDDRFRRMFLVGYTPAAAIADHGFR